MEKTNKYYSIIENLVKQHKKFPGYESILEDIIDDVYSHSEVIINSINNENVIKAYLEKVISTSIITVPKKLNFKPVIASGSREDFNVVYIDKMINMAYNPETQQAPALQEGDNIGVEEQAALEPDVQNFDDAAFPEQVPEIGIKDTQLQDEEGKMPELETLTEGDDFIIDTVLQEGSEVQDGFDSINEGVYDNVIDGIESASNTDTNPLIIESDGLDVAEFIRPNDVASSVEPDNSESLELAEPDTIDDIAPAVPDGSERLELAASDTIDDIAPAAPDGSERLELAEPDTIDDIAPAAPDGSERLELAESDTIDDIAPAVPDGSERLELAEPDTIDDIVPAVPDGSESLELAESDTIDDIAPAVPDGSERLELAESDTIDDIAPAVPDGSERLELAEPDTIDDIVPAVSDGSESLELAEPETIEDIAPEETDSFESLERAESDAENDILEIGNFDVGDMVETDVAGEALADLDDESSTLDIGSNTDVDLLSEDEGAFALNNEEFLDSNSLVGDNEAGLLEIDDSQDELSLEPEFGDSPEIMLEAGEEELLPISSDDMENSFVVDEDKVMPVTNGVVSEASPGISYSAFSYNPEINNDEVDVELISKELVNLNRKRPELNILNVYDLKYKEKLSISDIALQLEMSENDVLEALSEIITVVV